SRSGSAVTRARRGTSGSGGPARPPCARRRRQTSASDPGQDELIGTLRWPGGGEGLRALGADPVMLGRRGAGAVRKAVLESKPEAIVHPATALAGRGFSAFVAATRHSWPQADNDGPADGSRWVARARASVTSSRCQVSME